MKVDWQKTTEESRFTDEEFYWIYDNEAQHDPYGDSIILCRFRDMTAEVGEESGIMEIYEGDRSFTFLDEGDYHHAVADLPPLSSEGWMPFDVNQLEGEKAYWIRTSCNEYEETLFVQYDEEYNWLFVPGGELIIDLADRSEEVEIISFMEAEVPELPEGV